MSVIYLAGGCFWGVQKYFDQFDGIIKTTVGYANGHTENPKYEDVKAEKTGHVETVKIEYDESLRSLNQILNDYYKIIDPTSLNKQGEDEGISYRTGIYYTNESDLEIIQNKTNEIIKSITGEDVKYIRPPYGAYSDKLLSHVNMTPVLWSIDPDDWATTDTAYVVKSVVYKVKNGDIILLHDIYDSSVEAALEIIDRLSSKGFVFVTVDQLMLD